MSAIPFGVTCMCLGGHDPRCGIHRKEGNEMIEQLQQLCTVTWDGNLIAKHYRDRLVEVGYADRVHGFNFITANGLILLDNLNLLPEKSKR